MNGVVLESKNEYSQSCQKFNKSIAKIKLV